MFERLVVVVGEGAGGVERNSARVLVDRVRELSAIEALVCEEGEEPAGAAGTFEVLLGLPAHHSRLERALAAAGCRPPTETDPGPEGFVLRSAPGQGGEGLLLAAGVEPRSALYAVGAILRRMEFHDLSIAFPEELDLRTAPAFEVRGTQFDQGDTMLELTGARRWTEKERQRVVLDLAMAGANTIEVNPWEQKDSEIVKFIKSFDLKILLHAGSHEGDGGEPDEWLAKEGIGRRGYLCPSVPEARAFLLEKYDRFYRESPDYDYVRFYAADGGGCECERCKPWGKTFIHLCEEMSEIVHRYHPEAQIFLTNEKTDNAGDLAIWEYLREKPRPWIRGMCYGCGSDGMTWQPGRRQDHRMDLFRYPGFGPFSRYPQEIIHNLPPDKALIYYNELTHWWYSELGYVRFPPAPDARGDTPPACGSFIYERHPDFFLVQVFHRRTFFAWPRYYHRVFNDLLRFAIGDVTHSSGHHDHFNQWMWQRLLWDPHRPVEEVVGEYARAWFGPEAAGRMAEAVFQLEENLGGWLPTNEGVDRYYSLVKEAGWAMPGHRMERNWLWRQYMQKATLDKHVQLNAQRQLRVQERIEELLDRALQRDGADLGEAIATAVAWLDEIQGDTDEMARLRTEAGRLGDESEAIHGVRSEGYFNLDHDFIGLGWIRKTLKRAAEADAEGRRRWLQRIAHYEDAGEGGFYNNCGDPGGAPHMTHGTPYDHGQQLWEGALAETNRASQRLLAFTSHEEQGVTLEYEDLDPEARYGLRLTLVRPRYEEEVRDMMVQQSQSIYVNDILLADNLELPEHESEFFEFEVPIEATKTGRLALRFQKAPGVAEGPWVDISIWRNAGGWGTLVSEVWLYKLA